MKTCENATGTRPGKKAILYIFLQGTSKLYLGHLLFQDLPSQVTNPAFGLPAVSHREPLDQVYSLGYGLNQASSIPWEQGVCKHQNFRWTRQAKKIRDSPGSLSWPLKDFSAETAPFNARHLCHIRCLQRRCGKQKRPHDTIWNNLY